MKVIAEVGCNHKGDIEIAKKMIHVAADFCGVDVVKFQKRCPADLLSEEQYNAPHPCPENSYGDTYGLHREFLELDIKQHAILKRCCEDNGVTYSTSVWDLTSAKEVVGLHPEMIKIPSACNLDFEMWDYLCRHFAGALHVSLGMTTHCQEREMIHILQSEKRAGDVILYACTSDYPVAFADICLFEIRRLQEIWGDKVKAIGFSGHHYGIAADVAAMTLGAKYIERHFTLDRTWKGTDHAASLEPEGIRRLVRDLHSVDTALDYKQIDILDCEKPQVEKLKRI